MGDFCDANAECLTELCDQTQHKCVNQEKTERSRIFGHGEVGDPDIEETQPSSIELKNVVLVASILVFVVLAAFFIKCVQRQGANRSGQQRDPREIYREIKADGLDDSMTTDEIERFNIGHILARGASRRHFFTGKVKQPIDPVKKYAGQATPIQEDS